MQRKFQKVDPTSPEEKLRRKILAADFSCYPGDIRKFSDDLLRAEGIWGIVRQLEKDFASNPAFEKFEEGLSAVCPAAVQRYMFRWLCLLHRQNHLRMETITRIRETLERSKQEHRQRFDEECEGVGYLALTAFMNSKSLMEPELSQKIEHLRQAWRQKKRKEEERRQAHALKTSEIKRNRSGSAPSFPHSTDWTQPHTAQEYVDAFADKTIHKKKVRAFLKLFEKSARRRGRGRNKPLEYPVEAGLAVFVKAMTEWIARSDRRAELFFVTAAFQVRLSSALTPNGERVRKALASTHTAYPALGPLVTTEGWRIWHEALRAQGLVVDRADP